jgi:hypothetical protein
MRGQDVVARQAPVDKRPTTTEAIQSDKKVARVKSRTKAKSDSHMMFMGIPIDGTLDDFAPLLIEKDFTQSSFAKQSFSGMFYETLSTISVSTDKQNETINSVEVTFYTGVNGLSENQMVALYNRIVKGLCKKYANAKISRTDGDILLSMTLGYIDCKIYDMNLSRNFGGGTYIKLKYVDKKNTSNYSLPRLNKADDDL